MPFPERTNEWHDDARAALACAWRTLEADSGRFHLQPGERLPLALARLAVSVWHGEPGRKGRTPFLGLRVLLLNQPLAKSVNPGLNPLALQAGCELENAWDARSHWKNVLVPFVTGELARLGPSPFGSATQSLTNKAVRQPTVTTSTATRSPLTRSALAQLLEQLQEDPETAAPLTRLVLALCHREARRELLKAGTASVSPLKATRRRRALELALGRFLRGHSGGERPQATVAAVTATLAKLSLVGWSSIQRRNVNAADTIAGALHQLGDVNGFAGSRLTAAWEVKDYRLRLEHVEEKLALCRRHKVTNVLLCFVSRGIDESERQAIERRARRGEPRLGIDVRVEPDIGLWVTRHLDLLSPQGLERFRRELEQMLDRYAGRSDREAWAKLYAQAAARVGLAS